MTIKSNVLMITAAAIITGGAAFAQAVVDPAPVTPAPAPDSKPSIAFLLDLFGGESAPSKTDVAKAIEAEGYTPGRIRIEDDGDVNIRFFVDGVQYRVRLDGDELRYKMSDDGMDDTSDANGDDTSDTSDSNGDNSDSTSDGNGGSSSNSGSGGGSSDN